MRWNPDQITVYVKKIQKIIGSRRVKLLAITILLFTVSFIYYGISAGWLSRDSPEQDSDFSIEKSSGNFSPGEKELTPFINIILSDTEKVWNKIFTEKGGRYQKPKVILFSNQIDSACGVSLPSAGSFYCSSEHQVFVDLSFYQDLHNQLDAPGDFSQAYVLAHMVGHHVQNLIGITDKAQQTQQQMSAGESSRVSVKLELQADCYAGIWAKHTTMNNSVVEADTIEDALDAVSHLSNRLLLKQAKGGYIVQDPFGHSTSTQRRRWFNDGYHNGILEKCDTFTDNQ